MLKKTKIKILILLISIIILGGYFFISSLIGNTKKYSDFKSLLNVEQRKLIKKYIFPYKVISQQQQTISQQQQTVSQHQKILKIVNLPVIELEKKKRR